MSPTAGDMRHPAEISILPEMDPIATQRYAAMPIVKPASRETLHRACPVVLDERIGLPSTVEIRDAYIITAHYPALRTDVVPDAVGRRTVFVAQRNSKTSWVSELVHATPGVTASRFAGRSANRTTPITRDTITSVKFRWTP